MQSFSFHITGLRPEVKGYTIMMLENHLRHIKPFEFNRSVIWAGRIGLLLLLLVASLFYLPFVVGQMHSASVDSILLQSNQLTELYSSENLSAVETSNLKLDSISSGQPAFSPHSTVTYAKAAMVLAPRAARPGRLATVSSVAGAESGFG